MFLSTICTTSRLGRQPRSVKQACCPTFITKRGHRGPLFSRLFIQLRTTRVEHSLSRHFTTINMSRMPSTSYSKLYFVQYLYILTTCITTAFSIIDGLQKTTLLSISCVEAEFVSSGGFLEDAWHWCYVSSPLLSFDLLSYTVTTRRCMCILRRSLPSLTGSVHVELGIWQSYNRPILKPHCA